MDKIDIVELKSIEQVQKILAEFDDVFSPPLRNRVSDLNCYSKKLLNNGHVYVAILDREYVGFIAFYSNDRIAKVGYLSQIAIKKNCAIHDLAYRLILYFEHESIKNGMKSLRLEVFNDNDHALRFYERNGYTMDGKASDVSCYMVKKID